MDSQHNNSYFIQKNVSLRHVLAVIYIHLQAFSL
jgi:hypothetical protein